MFGAFGALVGLLQANVKEGGVQAMVHCSKALHKEGWYPKEELQDVRVHCHVEGRWLTMPKHEPDEPIAMESLGMQTTPVLCDGWALGAAGAVADKTAACLGSGLVNEEMWQKIVGGSRQIGTVQTADRIS